MWHWIHQFLETWMVEVKLIHLGKCQIVILPKWYWKTKTHLWKNSTLVADYAKEYLWLLCGIPYWQNWCDFYVLKTDVHGFHPGCFFFFIWSEVLFWKTFFIFPVWYFWKHLLVFQDFTMWSSELSAVTLLLSMPVSKGQLTF